MKFIEGCELCYSSSNCYKCQAGLFLFDDDKNGRFESCVCCTPSDGCENNKEAIFQIYLETGTGSKKIEVLI